MDLGQQVRQQRRPHPLGSLHQQLHRQHLERRLLIDLPPHLPLTISSVLEVQVRASAILDATRCWTGAGSSLRWPTTKAAPRKQDISQLSIVKSDPPAEVEGHSRGLFRHISCRSQWDSFSPEVSAHAEIRNG